MAQIPAIVDPTLAAVQSAVEQKAAASPRRRYLGMSEIGRPCERRAWYSFRWAVREEFAAPTLWRFEDGFRCEDVLADRLRLVAGITLRTVDPRTGKQFAFADFGGHFGGHADGMIVGILQAPKALHVWEAKAVNEDKLAKLSKFKADLGEKSALAQWDPIYYAQAVLYMAYSEVDRHYLTACSPGARDIVSVRTEMNLDAARALREKAGRIIGAAEPLPKISADPAWYECKFCPAHEVCHGGKLPAVNCRTCVHATPELDGNARWSCALGRREIESDPAHGCAAHRFIPALITFAEQVDASATENWIAYRMPDGRVFRNGERGRASYGSEELRVMNRAAIGDVFGDALRAEFNGQHVEPNSAPLSAPALPWAKGKAA